MKQLFYFFLVSTIVFLCSCGSSKNLTYFNDLQDSSAVISAIPKRPDPVVQAGDILVITVTSLNAESNQLFNKGTIANTNATVTSTLGGLNTTTVEGYLVNSDGNISFPVLGQVRLIGLTREEVRRKMVEELSTFVKDPIVSVRFNNFRITVVGEVSHPSTFVIPNEKISILEALGMAGDMTPYGRRNNVLLIREENGQRTIVRIDLNKHDVLNSPYYYLRQNDVVYVEPTKYRDPSTQRNLQLVSIGLSVISILTIVAVRINSLK
ncbi:MAG: sugar transporter [Sphingobacteriales bacterium]|nr:MAG: sugar transporter [Sphingobacteriales bacterium]